MMNDDVQALHFTALVAGKIQNLLFLSHVFIAFT